MRQQIADNRQRMANSKRQRTKFCRLPAAVCILTCCLSAAVCYAQMTFDEKSRALANQFRNPDWVSNVTFLIITVGVVTSAVLTLIIAERYYRSRNTKNGYYSHNLLFRELCQAHEFTNDQQTILRDIARELQLQNPAILFIEPKHLELALSESVVHFPQESIRQIYSVLFNREVVSSDPSKDENNTWFAWTKVIDNPEADQLKKEPKKETFDSLTDLSETQRWEPSLWQEVRQVAAHDTGHIMKPLEIVSTPSEPDQIVRKEAVYKPRYPETQDVPVQQSPDGQVSSSTGVPKTSLPKTPPSPGAQILSSMLYSVSDVTNELAYSSIRNHLTRSLSLSPRTSDEMKQRTSQTTATVSFDEVMVSSQKQKRQPDTQTQVRTETAPRIAIKQIELKSIDHKPPKPFLVGE